MEGLLQQGSYVHSRGKGDWRLPELQALPYFTQTMPTKPHHVRRPSQEEPYRVMRFAFVVVQKYMSSDIRRGWLIKQALASLQTTTMRLRARNPSIPPYSETQAYFWIQIIHAALASVYSANSTSKIPLPVTIDRLSFESFRILFDMQRTIWRSYYSVKTWDSMEARIAFVTPDVKPLPNVINHSVQGDIGEAFNRQLDNTKLGMAAELPSMEDLALRAALVVETARTINEPTLPRHGWKVKLTCCFICTTPWLQNRTPVLTANHRRCQLRVAPLPLCSVSQDLSFQLSRTKLSGPSKSSVSASGLSTSSHTDQPVPVPSFEAFINTNLYLAYENLALCYYSQELLGLLEAQETFVPPDRRKMRGFMAVEETSNQNEVDEWVVG